MLLRPAVRYALDAIETVTPDLLSRPTPCAKWNLQMLLSHTCVSANVLQEGLDQGRVGLFPDEDDDAVADPAGLVHVRLSRLLDQWNVADDAGSIAIADHRIPLSLMSGAAAIEIAVHGWDVYQASGHDQPIPAGLAAGLLPISHELILEGNRDRLFAPPLAVPAAAGPGEKLLAFLGRRSSAAPSIATEASSA